MNCPRSGGYRLISAYTSAGVLYQKKKKKTEKKSYSVLAFQAGQSSTVIENIHTIIAAAAVKFSFDQLTHLFVLIQKVGDKGF